MSFSPVSSAFTGFALVARKPGAFLLWIVAYIVMALICGIVIFAIAASSIMRLGQSGANMTDPNAIMSMMGTIWLAILAAIPLVLLMSAVMTAAVMRAVLKPEAKALGYLRLGGDELRLAVVMLVYILLIVVLYFVIALVAVGVVMASGAAKVPVGIAFGVVILAGLLYLGSRLSLAYPITLMQKRISIFDSWSLTKSKALPLYGMWLLIVVIMILVAVVSVVISSVTQGRPIGAMFNPASAALATPNLALLGVGFIVQLVLSTLQLAIIAGAQAAAYRDIVGTDVSKTF